ncbi:MAG: NUDIX domain-containing protein [Puniceicoccales bacterium]|nr:NUDIX domain-containing protein [Puniceicoccales bacterium]
MQAQSPYEIFDVVDICDRVVGQETRAEVHRRALLHRAVHVLVFDATGRLYLQQRSQYKDTCPGLFTASCAGHVDTGESYDAAAVRELGEELGIPAEAAARVSFLFKSGPCADTGWEFIQVYRLNWEGALRPNPLEISAGLSVSVPEVDAWLTAEPQVFAPSFHHLWKLFRIDG